MDPSHVDKNPRMVTNMGWPACSRCRCDPHSQSPQMPASLLSTPCARHQWPPAISFTSQKVWCGQIWISIGYVCNYVYIYIYIFLLDPFNVWIVIPCQVDLCEARPSWRIAWLNYHLQWRRKCCYNSPTFKQMWLHRRIPLWIEKMLSRKVKGVALSRSGIESWEFTSCN